MRVSNACFQSSRTCFVVFEVDYTLDHLIFITQILQRTLAAYALEFLLSFASNRFFFEGDMVDGE